MKKALWIFMSGIFLLIVLFILLATHGGKKGITDNVKRNLGSSSKYSTEEINEAMDCVIEKFKDFEGCELTDLWYDEDFSNTRTADYKNDTAIVLLSNFDVDSSGGDGSLNPNSTYSKWMWILTRESEGSNWQVRDWGYG